MNYIVRVLVLLSLFVGCSENVTGGQTETYPFEVNVGLEQDINGYYHLVLSQYGNSNQTIHQFSVNTNNPNTNPPQFVYWDADTQYEIELFGQHTEMVDIINHSSYATSEGIAYTMFGPHSEQVGDTITIFVGYICNEYSVEYSEQFMVVLDSPDESCN